MSLMPKKKKRKNKSKKTIPLNLKTLGNDITKYPFVEIEWLDIEGDGYLVSQKNGVTRIFTDYIKTKDKPTFDNIGNTTIIPTAVIESIKKLN